MRDGSGISRNRKTRFLTVVFHIREYSEQPDHAETKVEAWACPNKKPVKFLYKTGFWFYTESVIMQALSLGFQCIVLMFVRTVLQLLHR